MHVASNPRGSGLLGICLVVASVSLLHATSSDAPAPTREIEHRVTNAQARPMLAPRPLTAGVDETSYDESENAEDDIEVRAHEPISGPEELAMVFRAGDDWYVRLANDLTATSRGPRTLVERGGIYAAVAPVSVSALPDSLRGWNGREVLVDGECHARVIGFAEVSRALGLPEGTYDDEDETYVPGAWTAESLAGMNVMLAGKLDGCSGTWARAASYPAASVIARIDDPELENAAVAALLRDDQEATDVSWRESGGEGDWRDEVDIETQAYRHPLTGETWVFVQARTGGPCGEPSVTQMRAYRADERGGLRKVADLDYGYETLRGVVDLDGDGQVELMVGEGEYVTFADLTSSQLESIYVESYAYEGCGC